MANNNIFPSFLDTSSNTNTSGAGPRSAPSPTGQQQQQPGNNGNGAGLNGLPMLAGQQMDVNFLYQRVVELSEVLRGNREKTQAIITGAEELGARAAAKGASTSLQEANAEISAARIADLERQLGHEQNKVRTLIHEQKENMDLIGDYENKVGDIVKDVREYSYRNKAEKTAISRHYNKLLQDEKDAHLASRLEKDDMHNKFLRAGGMLREAHRLRCEEEELPIRIISGLQNEVRAYRSALGIEPEKFEEEYGYEILKNLSNGSGEP